MRPCPVILDSVKVDSVGSVLRRAREKKRLTLKNVAWRLRLKERAVQALERDEYHKMAHNKVYFVGFVRSYCRVVGLDSGPIVDQLEFNLPHLSLQNQKLSLLTPLPALIHLTSTSTKPLPKCSVLGSYKKFIMLKCCNWGLTGLRKA